MNEPKKRGRPSKAEIAARQVASGLVNLTTEQVVDDIEAGVRVILTVDETERAVAQAYADRMWAKQSVSLSRHERMGRIAAALAAQGLSMEGVVLP